MGAKAAWSAAMNMFKHMKAWFVNIESPVTNYHYDKVIINVLIRGVEHSGSQDAKDGIKRLALLNGVEQRLHRLVARQRFNKREIVARHLAQENASRRRRR